MGKKGFFYASICGALEMIQQIIEYVLQMIAQYAGENISRDTSIRIVFLIFVSGFFTILAVKWKIILIQFSGIRRAFDRRERFVGTYVQPIFSDDEGLRYTIIHIFFRRPRSEYEVRGESWTHAGDFFGSFESRYVVFPSDQSIEFVWSGREQDKPLVIGGLTRVEFADHDLERGRGFSVDFLLPARTNRFLFERIQPPKDSQKFLVDFHAKRGESIFREFQNSTQCGAEDRKRA